MTVTVGVVPAAIDTCVLVNPDWPLTVAVVGKVSDVAPTDPAKSQPLAFGLLGITLPAASAIRFCTLSTPSQFPVARFFRTSPKLPAVPR